MSANGRTGTFTLGHKPTGSVASLCREGPVFTIEPAPHIDHYRNVFSINKESIVKRPTLQDLHRELELEPEGTVDHEEPAEVIGNIRKVISKQVKFGWIVGVLIRCVLNILGALLYLRLTWMAGQCGVGLASFMILISAVVTILTSLSMCAICTNGEIRGGGAYFMLSRALGPEFGGSMGLIFSLANALAAALHATGFAETVRDLLKEYGLKIVDGDVNDIRIVSICTLALLMAVVILGLSVEVKAQIVLLFILAVSYAIYIIGTFIPPSTDKLAKGITGYSWETLADNFGPHFRGENFFSIFAVYFPAATGIMAGANISGDLKDPSVAIPKGTLIAILATSLVYLSAIWVSGATVLRDASGSYVDLVNGNLSACADTGTCPYGLMNYFQTMQMQSAFGPLIIAGIFAATLSSALACLVSGPKLFQAVARDKLFPKIDWFVKGYGRNDEPRRAYVLGFVISLAMACVGDLNTIAPFISNFYLATYALINFACFHGSLAKSPGWRPAFKYYNRWLSCIGALLCIAGMFMMSYIAAPLTFLFMAALYTYLSRRKPDVNWGSSNHAHQYVIALKSILGLLKIEPHVKTYRAQILALTGNPAARPSMVDFVRGIARQRGLLVFGHIVPRCDTEVNWRTYEKVRQLNNHAQEWLNKRGVKGFYCPVTATNTRDGLRTLLETSGLGKMKPNIVMLGFKNCWKQCHHTAVKEYFELIHECFDADMAVCVLRVQQGLDFSSQMLEYNLEGADSLKPAASKRIPAAYRGSFDALSDGPTVGHDRQPSNAELTYLDEMMKRAATPAGSIRSRNLDLSVCPDHQRAAEVISTINQFRVKCKEGTVDVWWLIDDGGLALLVPYLLVTQKSYLQGLKLRVFSTANDQRVVSEQQKSMVALLEKFRISASDVTIIDITDQQPSSDTLSEFNKLIQPFVQSDGYNSCNNSTSTFITETELDILQEKTNRHLRTRELLLEHSKNSSLVVITLPVPRKNGISAYLYLAWMEMLSNFTTSPVLLVRGNHQSVLTFYS